MAMHIWDYAPDALEVSVTELIVTTADQSDDLVDDTVRQVLQDLRENLKMDVIFLSEIREGKRMFKHVDNKPGCDLIATGGGSRLEESFCQCVLDGRLPKLVHDAETHRKSAKLPDTPFRVGAHISAPIVLANGQIYGTLCTFSTAADPSLTQKDLQKLECVARVAAKRIDLRFAKERDETIASWQLQPLAEAPFNKAWGDKLGSK
ncbi:GAF domain-containing protein [Diaphorobacter sp. HDW4A]|nr:GAF domain-containing protein [Diaphorobacter sp. HDW4A]